MGWEKLRRCNLPEAARIPVPDESEVRKQTAGHLECVMQHQEEIVGMDPAQIRRLMVRAARSPLKGEAFFADLRKQKKRSKRSVRGGRAKVPHR